MERVGTRLKRFRLQHGWSKRHTANELGVSIPSVIRWEEGKSTPNDYNRFKIESLISSSSKEADLVR